MLTCTAQCVYGPMYFVAQEAPKGTLNNVTGCLRQPINSRGHSKGSLVGPSMGPNSCVLTIVTAKTKTKQSHLLETNWSALVSTQRLENPTMTALPASSGGEPVEATCIPSDLTVYYATTSGKATTNKASVEGKALCRKSEIEPITINMRTFQIGFPFSAVLSERLFAASTHVNGLYEMHWRNT